MLAVAQLVFLCLKESRHNFRMGEGKVRLRDSMTALSLNKAIVSFAEVAGRYVGGGRHIYADVSFCTMPQIQKLHAVHCFCDQLFVGNGKNNSIFPSQNKTKWMSTFGGASIIGGSSDVHFRSASRR